MCIDCVSEKSSRDRVGYFKILVFPFHDVGSLAICTNAIEIWKNKFKSAMVNKPLMFKLLRFDCMCVFCGERNKVP